MHPRPPLNDPAVLDVQGALKRLGGRRQPLINALKKFTPECEKSHELIVRFLSARDREAASRIAHTVKGSAAVIGAANLSRVAAELETRIPDNGPEIENLLSIFRGELEKTMHAINGFLEVESQTEGQET